MGYKMKGFSGFKDSPVKQDKDLLARIKKLEEAKGTRKGADPVAAQARLDEIELGYREPGWAKAAKEIVPGVEKLVGKAIKKKMEKSKAQKQAGALDQEIGFDDLPKEGTDLISG